MLPSSVYDTALPAVKRYVPRMLRDNARMHMSTAERSASAVDRGIGQLAQNFKRSQRDAPQDDAAPGLTLRRQHGPLVAFFTCRGMNLYAQTLSRVSKCYALISVEYVHCLLIYSPQGWKGAEKSIACFV